MILIIKIPLENIIPNPYQPQSRNVVSDEEAKELALDILAHGLTYIPKARVRRDLLPQNGFSIYEMADGWRRRAAFDWLSKNGHSECSSISIEDVELSDQQMADIIHSANDLHRVMNFIERAEYYENYLKNFHISETELAKRQGCNQGEISNSIRMLKLSKPIIDKIFSKEISETHGLYLLRLNPYPELQTRILQTCIRDQWSANRLSNEISNSLFNLSKNLDPDIFPKPAFDLKNCEGCEYRQKIGTPFSHKQKSWRCLKPECWQEKQEAALAQVNITTEKQAALPLKEDKEPLTGNQFQSSDGSITGSMGISSICSPNYSYPGQKTSPAETTKETETAIKTTLSSANKKNDEKIGEEKGDYYCIICEKSTDLAEIFYVLAGIDPVTKMIIPTNNVICRTCFAELPNLQRKYSISQICKKSEPLNESLAALLNAPTETHTEEAEEDYDKAAEEDFSEPDEPGKKTKIPNPSYKLKKIGISWVALENELIIAIGNNKSEVEIKAKEYFKSIQTKINPGTGDYVLNHTYRFEPVVDNLVCKDVVAQDINIALAALGLSPMEIDVEATKVYKSSGKIGTWGGCGSGWSKCTETLYIQSQKTESDKTPENSITSRQLITIPEAPAKKEDFSSLQIKIKTKAGMPHVFTCSGKRAEGEDLKEAAVGLCRELGIKFDSPVDLASLLKTDFPSNRNRDLLISFLEPIKIGDKVKEPAFPVL